MKKALQREKFTPCRPSTFLILCGRWTGGKYSVSPTIGHISTEPAGESHSQNIFLPRKYQSEPSDRFYPAQACIAMSLETLRLRARIPTREFHVRCSELYHFGASVASHGSNINRCSISSVLHTLRRITRWEALAGG